MHEEAEEGHEIDELGRLKFGHHIRDELWDELGNGGTDGIDKL